MAHTFTFTITVELEREQGKFATRDMAVANAVPVTSRPSRQRRLKLGFAFVEFKRTILAQHVTCARRFHQARPLGFGELHQGCLCRQGALIA